MTIRKHGQFIEIVNNNALKDRTLCLRDGIGGAQGDFAGDQRLSRG